MSDFTSLLVSIKSFRVGLGNQILTVFDAVQLKFAL